MKGEKLYPCVSSVKYNVSSIFFCTNELKEEDVPSVLHNVGTDIAVTSIEIKKLL